MNVTDSPTSNHFLLPITQVVTSIEANWTDLQLAWYKSPASYIPSYVSTCHTLCINTGNPITLERTIDGYSQTIDAIPVGDIGFYLANTPQTFQWYQAAECIQLYLQPSLLHRISVELCLKDTIVLLPKLTLGADPLIYQIAIALKAALELEGAASKLYADSMANALAVHLLTRYSTQRSLLSPQPARGLSGTQLRQVLDYIHNSLEQDVSLNELANLTQLSSFHFARLFKQAVGLAPHRYHIRCRVDRAKQLLLEQKLSLAEIALAVGFASQGHLNYHFKRWVGTTPKAFLRQK